MSFRILFIIPAVLFVPLTLLSQENEALNLYKGIITDTSGQGIPESHVINISANLGTTSDRLGRFEINANAGDSIRISNLAYKDTLVIATDNSRDIIIKLSLRKYPIKELKVFSWGSDYGDFKRAFLALPSEPNLSEKLNLPVRKGSDVPFWLEKDKISNPVLLLTNPVSFLYYNLSRYEKSARKVYELGLEKDERDRFNFLVGRNNIARITGFTGAMLDSFLIFLNTGIQAGPGNTEYEIIREIHSCLSRFSTLKKMEQVGDTLVIRAN